MTEVEVADSIAKLGISANELWWRLLDQIPSFAALFAPDGTVTFVNRMALEREGLRAEQLAGRPLWQAACWCNSSVEQRHVRPALESAARGEIVRTEFSLRTPRNTVVTIDAQFSPLRDDRQRVVAVVGSAVDVTAHKAAEAAALQRTRDLRTLSACNEALIHLSDEQDLLASICRLIVEVGGYVLAWIGFARHDAEQSVSIAAAAGRDTDYLKTLKVSWGSSPSGAGPTGRAIRECRPVICRDLHADPSFAPWRDAAHAHDYESSIALPIVLSSAERGTLNIYSDRKDVFDDGEQKLLEEFAADLAYGIDALRNRQQRDRMQQQVDRLMRILRMQSSIQSAVLHLEDAGDLLTEACRVATDLGGYDYAVLWKIDETAQEARPVFASGDVAHPLRESVVRFGDEAAPDGSLLAHALRTRELAVCNDLGTSQPPVLVRERLLALGYKSLAVIPLFVGGQSRGALQLASKDANLIGAEEVLLLREISATLVFALDSREKVGAAQRLLYFDPLTGLAKRSLFCERLDGLLRTRAPRLRRVAVAAFDIGGLADINDTFGRERGDTLLQQIGDRLKHVIESDESIGYLEGGVFAVVDISRDEVDHAIEHLLQAAVFDRPFDAGGHSIRLTYTLGLSESSGHGESAAALVQNAEAALQRAKKTGEPYLHFHERIHSEIAERLELEHALREAIDARQFILHYQPQIDLETGRTDTVEALLRWKEPGKGLMLPARFLAALESSGMIVEVGALVLQQAVEDCSHWRSVGLGPLRVAVNVSSLQLRQRSFVDEVVVLSWGLNEDGYGLDLEVTETSVLLDLEAATRKLTELRAAGIRIALDDFGTGYSALGLLSKLPVDTLKIDRSFVRGLPDDPASTALTSSMIQLASAFRLGVVAEGVETKGQITQLRKLGCRRVQGYAYAPPLGRQDLEEFVRLGSCRAG